MATQPAPEYPPPAPPGPVHGPQAPGASPGGAPPGFLPAAGPLNPPLVAVPQPAPAGRRISANWGWSIASLFFFLILGAVAVWFSSQVNTRLAAGNVAGAMDASRKARLWGIAAIVVGVVVAVVLFTTSGQTGA